MLIIYRPVKNLEIIPINTGQWKMKIQFMLSKARENVEPIEASEKWRPMESEGQ